MTVVVGADGSPGSAAAIRLAAQEARYRHAALVAVMVSSGERAVGAAAIRPVATLRTAQDERALAEADLRSLVTEALGGQADQVECRVLTGMPGRHLVEAARSENAELLVIATRSDGVGRLLGTVSQYVLRNAPCPVLVVPDSSKGL